MVDPTVPAVVTKTGFTIAGVSFDANLQEIEQQQLGAVALEQVRAERQQLPERLSDHI